MERQNALLSVHNKVGITEFAKDLVELGYDIYATRGTCQHIAASGIPVTDVAELIGSGPTLDHRVVTLSQQVHTGLLAVRGNPEHEQQLRLIKTVRFDLLRVGFGPIVGPDTTNLAEIIQSTDVGGPAMLLAACKGQRIVICRDLYVLIVINWLQHGRPDADSFIRGLVAIGYEEVVRYTDTLANYYRVLSAQEMVQRMTGN